MIHGKELNLNGEILMLEKGQASRNQPSLGETIQPYHGVIDRAVEFAFWPCHCVTMGIVQFSPMSISF